MKLMKSIALIPARNGSVGIKNKNLIKLKGLPLIEYSFKESIKSKFIHKIFLSTNDNKIKKLAKKYKKIEIINRKNKLCTSKALMSEVICDAIKRIKKIHNLNNFNLILLQPTSPLRKAKHIDYAISIFNKNRSSKNLVSISKPINHPYELLYFRKNIIKSINGFKQNINRQDLKDFYFINGNIFISNANEFLKKKKFLNKNTQTYKMEKKYSIELDDYVDLKIIRGLMNDF